MLGYLFNASWKQSSVYFAKLAVGCCAGALALVFTKHCVGKTALKSNCMVCFGSLQKLGIDCMFFFPLGCKYGQTDWSSYIY